jgi:hypothetical protein
MSRLLSRLRRTEPAAPGGGRGDGDAPGLAARVSALEDAVEENRRLNQRLADVVDVVTELLVPALDRDDARVIEALANLNKTLDEG